jgi:hypothetical protein
MSATALMEQQFFEISLAAVFTSARWRIHPQRGRGLNLTSLAVCRQRRCCKEISTLLSLHQLGLGKLRGAFPVLSDFEKL